MSERTFTQAELDRIVQDRLSKEQAKHDKELEELKASQANAGDAVQLKKDLDTLQDKLNVYEREKSRGELEKRLDTAMDGKAFNHPAIKDFYLNKFEQALTANTDNKKTDKELALELIKDDATALKGVTVGVLRGGQFATTQDADIIKQAFERKIE